MAKSQIEKYLASLLTASSKEMQMIEAYAEEHSVPIMDKISIQFISQLIMINKPNNILEIGTAIGYSAIKMAQAAPQATIVTIDRDEERLALAKENIERFSLQERIHIINGDGESPETLAEVKQFAPYDLLFIDASKGKYEKFFQQYEPLLSTKGMIISDNVLFKGIVAGEKEAPTRRVKQMIGKLRRYNEERMQDPRFDTMIYPIGDGIMVSYKNK